MLVEFHCHTSYSPDSLASPERNLEACREKGIQRLVITDHNTIQGALAAARLDPGLVIVGEEVMTSQGELLAAFVQEGVPAGLDPEEAIRRLRAQDAFISVSHPFDRMRKGHWLPADLKRIAPQVDAIEVFNSRVMLPWYNWQAAAFARQHGLCGTAGSDAHVPGEIGGALVELASFTDAAELRQAMQTAQYRLHLAPPWVHFYSRYAKSQKSRPA